MNNEENSPLNRPDPAPIGSPDGAAAPAPRKRSTYKPFTRKERLLPSILLSLLAPLTVCFIAPFEIYGNNIAEFKFVLGDFIGLCLLIALGAALLLFAVLSLLRGRAFDVGFGLLFGLSLMLFLQSNYLSLNRTALLGDGTGESLPLWQILLNTSIWIVIPVICVLCMWLLNRFRDTLRLVVTMVLAIMIFMGFVSFVTISLTTDVYTTDKTPATEESTAPDADTEHDTSVGGNVEGTESESDREPEPADDINRLLTVEGLNTLATKENIVIFLVDRFDRDYYYDALAACPEIFDELAGFTYFDDYVSLYPRTFPAVTHLITGVETDFTLPRLQYFQTAYETSPVMYALKDAGYDIHIYTDTYYSYENATHMGQYVSNISHKSTYKIVERPRLSLDMLRLSLYRSLPTGLCSLVGDISTPTFNKYVEYDTDDEVYTTDMKDLYEALTATDFTFRESEKGYSFIHMLGCHLPNVYDENFDPIEKDDKYSAVVAMKQSFKIIHAYIREMKRMGVYENATILILGDHASIGSDRKDPYYAHMTSLLVKPAGVSEGATVTSSAPITTTDIHATILAAAGIDLPEDKRTVFEIPEDEIRTRRYLFQRTGDPQVECLTYEIIGDGRDFDNWRIIDRYYAEGSLYR